MGALGAIGSGLLAGVGAGLMGGPDPTYNKQSLDANGTDALQKVNDRANESIDSRVKTQMDGTQDAANPYLHAMDQANPKDVNDALQQRLNRSSSIAMNSLKNSAGFQATNQRGLDMMTAASLNQQKYQLDVSQGNAMLAANSQKNATQNSLIGSITGSLGKLAGAAVGNLSGGSSASTASSGGPGLQYGQGSGSNFFGTSGVNLGK